MRGVRRFLLALFFVALATAAGLAYPLLARPEAWSGVRWQNPWMLCILLVVPFVFYFGTSGQDRRMPRLRVGTISPFATGPRGFRSHLRDLPGALRAVALILLALAMARPISVLRDQKTDDTGIDIVMVLDLSGSMRAVLDADPKDLPGNVRQQRGKRMTRLEVAKIVMQDFVSRRKSDRIGVVVFGKSAFVLAPPTRDYHLLTQMIGKMTLQVIDGSATAIGDALGTAAARLRRSDAQSKVVVLLTDGDSNAGALSPEYATQLAQKVGAKVYTIQIGDDDEVDVEDGIDLFGQPRYVRHRFPVNPALLERIATATGGQAYVATDGKALASSMHSVLDQLEKSRFQASVASFEDLFPFFLFPGVLLIGLDALLRALMLRRFP